MPPKAKTPSEEAAMESPKLDQMLAMLQGMSEKISEFDLRMVAVEKKSDAAREAVDAIKRVDKGDSLENAREQKTVCRRVKFEGSRKYPAESSRGEEEEGDVEIISRSEIVVAKIGAHVKTVLTIMGSKKSSTKKAEQAEYVESLKVAFETTMNGQIESSVELLTRPKKEMRK